MVTTAGAIRDSVWSQACVSIRARRQRGGEASASGRACSSDGPASERAAEGGAEAVRELAGRQAMVLRAGVRDLDRAQERGDAAGGLPVEPCIEAVDQPRAVRIAASRRIDDGVGAGRGDGDLAAARVG